MSEGRARRAKGDDNFAYLILNRPPAYLNAFAAGLYAPRPETLHRDDLLSPPNHYKEVLKHPYHICK